MDMSCPSWLGGPQRGGAQESHGGGWYLVAPDRRRDWARNLLANPECTVLAGRYWEIGIIGHGPARAALADDVATAIAEWHRDYGNDAPEPGFRISTAATRHLLTATDPRFVIDKTFSRLVVDWP